MSRSRSGKIVCADCANSTICPDWDFVRSVVSKGGTCEAPTETGGCGRKVGIGEVVFIMDTGQRFRESAVASDRTVVRQASHSR